MLTITDKAGAVLRATILAAEEPVTGVRLSAAPPLVSDNGAGRVVRVDLVREGALDDEVLEAPGGAPVFVDTEVAPWISDKVLDASIDDRGRTSLVIVGSSEV